MDPCRPGRLSRRSLLAYGAALTAAGLVLPFTRSAHADPSSATSATSPTSEQEGEDGSDTVSVEVPDNVRQGQRWVDVNLSQQVAVAMLGADTVRVILTTTGQPGWETPAGQFRILYRVADERMTSDALGIPRDGPDGYDLDHVLWTQYFTDQGHALHDNYWRPLSVFGREATSHGCVGMVEDDAAFLWGYVGNGSLVNIHY